MAEEFDADALLAVLDIPEMAAAPPHLVEQLRALVREKAGRAPGTPGEPIRLEPPPEWSVREDLPPPRYGMHEGEPRYYRDPLARPTFSGTLAWPGGTSVEFRDQPHRVVGSLAGEMILLLPLGGRAFLIPLRDGRGGPSLTAAAGRGDR